jgi:hypothetical protein
VACQPFRHGYKLSTTGNVTLVLGMQQSGSLHTSRQAARLSAVHIMQQVTPRPSSCFMQVITVITVTPVVLLTVRMP